jgi:acyl dehydratase
MLDRSLIGRVSEPVVHEVEKGTIKRFSEALNEPGPIHTNEGAATAAGFRSLVAPLTFAATLGVNERFLHSLDLGSRPALHGEQQMEYFRRIVAGDRITVRSKVVDVAERPGASGAMSVLVIEDEGRDEAGELVFRARKSLVLRR